jgi:hypothetical protein
VAQVGLRSAKTRLTGQVQISLTPICGILHVCPTVDIAFNVCCIIIIACWHRSVRALKPEEGVCGLGLIEAIMGCEVYLYCFALQHESHHIFNNDDIRQLLCTVHIGDPLGLTRMSRISDPTKDVTGEKQSH